MASGKLGTADIALATNISLYTVPASTLVCLNISLVNRTAAAINVRIAIATTASPTSAEYIEYDFPLAANNVIERTGITCTAGEQVVVYCSAVGVSARVYGIEEAA